MATQFSLVCLSVCLSGCLPVSSSSCRLSGLIVCAVYICLSVSARVPHHAFIYSSICVGCNNSRSLSIDLSSSAFFSLLFTSLCCLSVSARLSTLHMFVVVVVVLPLCLIFWLIYLPLLLLLLLFFFWGGKVLFFVCLRCWPLPLCLLVSVSIFFLL